MEGAIGAGCLLLGTVAYVGGAMATVVPPGHQAVVLWMGKFSHIIGPGTHYLKWPAENVLEFRTKYKEECAGRIIQRQKEFWKVPTTTQVFDVVPITATSSDRINVTINLVFHFRFTDTQKLLQLGDYGTMLENITVSAISTYANKHTARDIKSGGIEQVSNFVEKYTNDSMQEMGLQIVQTLVQEIKIQADHDSEISRIEKQARIAEMNAQHTQNITEANVKKRRLELDGKRETDLLQVKNENQKILAEINAKREQADAELVVQKALLEKARIEKEIKLTDLMAQAEFMERLKQSGTFEGFVDLERAHAVSVAVSKNKARVFACDMKSLMPLTAVNYLTSDNNNDVADAD
jgi:regulator of protease activity HflC (stomatin/prohibitin superfamily)